MTWPSESSVFAVAKNILLYRVQILIKVYEKYLFIAAIHRSSGSVCCRSFAHRKQGPVSVIITDLLTFFGFFTTMAMISPIFEGMVYDMKEKKQKWPLLMAILVILLLILLLLLWPQTAPDAPTIGVAPSKPTESFPPAPSSGIHECRFERWEPLFPVANVCTTNQYEAVCSCGKTSVKEGESHTRHYYQYDGICSRCGAYISLGLEYELNPDGESYSVIGLGVCLDKDLVIPDTHEGKPVVRIAKEAFCDRSDLTGVYIPDSVTEIGEKTFKGCYGLTTVRLPAGLRRIEEETFKSCSRLEDPQLPQTLEYIGDFAFDACNALYNITLPDTLTELGRWAFYGCQSLHAIRIPGSLQNIGNNVFGGCTALVDVQIEEGVPYIGNTMFGGCSSLTTLVLPSTITRLDAYAFAVSGIRDITLNAGIWSIDTSAFENCGNLVELRLPDTVTTLNSSLGRGPFVHCANLKTLYLPASLLSFHYNYFDFSPNVKDIYFAGTMEQWNSIQKYPNPNGTNRQVTVHCSDGSFAVNL